MDPDCLSQPNDTQRQLKDLQYIDQSMRTVATQLLNISNAEDTGKILDSNLIKKASQKPVDKNDASAIKESDTIQSMTIGFGRPVNSKFSYFETSHPGQAMAITEEELEKEMSSTRLMTAYKAQPTTTGGISTWILLNPPSTTMKPTEVEKKTKEPSEAEVQVTLKPTTLMERVDTTDRVIEKVTMPIPTTVYIPEPSTTKKSVIVTTKRTETKPEKTQNHESSQNSTSKVSQSSLSILESKEASVGTTKKVQMVRTTPKPKTASKNALSKPSTSKNRPNQQARPKPLTRRTTIKPDIMKNENASTAKVEKVTFRPVQMITISKDKPENSEKPMFVTKIKASILMDTQKTTTLPVVSASTTLDFTTTSKPSSSNSDLIEVPVKLKPVGTKLNNVLKVQLKKPVDEATKIEIEPIKVNAPVLKIEKVEKDKEAEKDSLDSSKIDLQFDFNPELTKINVDTETSSSTTTTTQASTTKRPRQSTKRKKNKGRRRKPATSTTTTTIAPLTSSTTETELMSEESVAENDIQESKIAPETKLAANSTKTKKKQVQKPISTQIYNFLSREVMPSFGVMSLVGLGLGLASYFLYPFGGTIARRNYEVEPKYKYNFDEYGGNYGQNEEEVLSKVLQGMTTDDNKYQGVKDYNNNYYQYQHYDGSYEPQTTKKYEQRYSSASPMYRPENTASALKYKNTEYRYPEAPSTPSYYERTKHSEYVVGQAVPVSANRQFVVGSVPKEYPPYEDKSQSLSTSGKLANSYEATESGQFNHDLGQNFNFNGGSVQSYSQVQTARPEEGYEEVEITPTAVAVEHGPRSLKTNSRRKRDSVIQIIPSKREFEEEEKEENLSNEILNIIDSALPGEAYDATMSKKENELQDLEAQRKQKEKDQRLKDSTTTETSTDAEVSTQESTSSAVKDSNDSSSPSASTEAHSDGITTPNSKNTETTDEWIDLTTQKPPEQNGFNLFSFVKKIAEIKFRLGLTLLKHASEGFARYLGHVQKRINGEE